MRTDNENVTPSLTETIQMLIDSKMIDQHTCLPAKVTEYDHSTQIASVQISLLKKYENSLVAYPWPIVPNVPVVFPRAVEGQAFIHMPLTVGDDVTLVICERSLDTWKLTGELSDPASRRRFNVTDAFAFPGGSAEPLAFDPDDATSLQIKNLVANLILKASGEIKFNNSIASVTLKADGTIQIENSVATISASPAGDILVENNAGSVEISPSGTITADGPMVNLGSGASHGAGLGDNIENRLSALESEWSTFITSYNTHIHNTTAPGAPTLTPLPPAGPFVPGVGPAASTTVKVST